MSATTTQGTGTGSSEGLNKGPGNGRNIYQSLNGPHIVLAGQVYNDECWQTLITFPSLPSSPDKYVILVTQTDWANNDGSGYRPSHTEKLDQYGDNLDDNNNEWPLDAKLSGFVLHGGSENDHRYDWVIIKAGGAFSYEYCY